MLIPLEKLLEGRKGARKRRQTGNVGMTELVKRKREKEKRKQEYLQKQKKTPKAEKPKKKDATQPIGRTKRKQARGGLKKKAPSMKPRAGGLKGDWCAVGTLCFGGQG